MTGAAALARAKLAVAAHFVAGARRESRLKVAVVLAAVVVLWIGGFLLARAALSFVDRTGAELLGTSGLSVTQILMPRALALFATALLAMLAVSSAFLAFSTLFRSREMELLLVTPLPVASLFTARVLEVAVLASWSTAYVASTVLLAFGVLRHAPLPFYLAAGVLFVPFVVIPAATGTVAAVAAAWVLPRIGRRTFAVATALLAVAAFVYFRARLGQPLPAASARLGVFFKLVSHPASPYLPSTWLADGIMAAAHSDLAELGFDFLALLAHALLALWLAARLAERALLPAWSGMAGIAGRRRRLRAATLERWLVLVPRPVRHLAAKDIRVFLRDPALWLQAGVFFGVLAVYVAGMRTTSRGFSAAFWRDAITVLNTAASLLVLAAVTTRFAFPLVSLEGKRFWLVGLAPVTRRVVVLEKFALTASAAAGMTMPLAAVSGMRLGLSPAMLAASLVATLAASLALSGLAVGLGSVYPDFTAEDPARIVSGLGGTVNLLLSVAYVVAATAAQTVVLAGGRLGRHGAGGRPGLAAAVFVLLLVVSGLVAWLPLRLGIASLENAEL